MVNNMKQAYNISTELLHILNNYNNGDDDLYHLGNMRMLIKMNGLLAPNPMI